MTDLLTELRATLETAQRDPQFKTLSPHTRERVNQALETLYTHRAVARPIPNEYMPIPYDPDLDPFASAPVDIDEFIAQIRAYYK